MTLEQQLAASIDAKRKEKGMTDLGDILNVPAGDGDWPETGKQADLVNRIFTIHDHREVQTSRGESHIISVTFDGDEQQHEFWFGGVYAIKQLEALVLHEAFPARVKLVKMKVGQGDAYHLIAADGDDAGPPVTRPPEKAEKASLWVDGLTDTCSEWMRANGGAQGVTERIFDDGLPAEILQALKIDKDTNKATGWNLTGASQAKQKALIAALKADMEQPTTPDELPFE